MRDQFRSMEFAHLVRIPAFVFHGTADAVVPFAQGEKVFAALAGPKEFRAIAGGQHVAPLTEALWVEMKTFLDNYVP